MSFFSYTHTHTHTCVSSVRTDGVATSFGKLKRVEQKVPGFMLIFIKIILTCNVAAGSVHRTTQDEGKKDERLSGRSTQDSAGSRLATNFLVSLQVYLVKASACVFVYARSCACECKSCGTLKIFKCAK